MIQLLDQNTINQIAAGEVIERPSSVVKELVENAMDSGASAITVEIKDGGLSLIRITDNGSGIDKNEVRQAFLRHATSKITKAEDLLTVSSLGFRGEALASIAAVAQVEMITKTKGALTGCRYEIHGGVEQAYEEIGCPEGTTLIVRNLFYNTPARKKFMKSAMTEGGYVQELMMRLAMSKPHIAMQFILNGKNKLSTPGNGRLKEVVYQVYGRDITANLLEVSAQDTHMRMEGYIGKPFISRGNRLFENYFINGRYMKNAVITKAIEEAYRTFVMVHKFPFTAISLELEPSLLDINVHPTKMEMRYQESDKLYQFIYRTIRESLLKKELIPKVSAGPAKEDRLRQEPDEAQPKQAEPFETVRREHTDAASKTQQAIVMDALAVYQSKAVSVPDDRQDTAGQDRVLQKERMQLASHLIRDVQEEAAAGMETASKQAPQMERPAAGPESQMEKTVSAQELQTEKTAAGQESRMEKPVSEQEPQMERPVPAQESQIGKTAAKPEQMSMFTDKMLSAYARPRHRIIGQLFETYWLIEYDNQLFIMDQHAAHERVMYEHFMRKLMDTGIYSQQLYPPQVVTLSPTEEAAFHRNASVFEKMGFQIEPFGGREFAIRAVPEDIFGISSDDVFSSLIADLSDEGGAVSEEIFVVKLSMMACKAAVKGNMRLSGKEVDALLDELLTLENPYNCPHGRPTIISMSKTDIEKKFKRIQDK